MTAPPCAGVIVFRVDGDAIACALVQARHGGWGFPKGKRNRREPFLAGALRELREETGLTPEQIALVAGELDELSDKGNPAVRYGVARLLDREAVLVAPPDEKAVAWATLEEARSRLGKRRREVLARALELLEDG